MKGAIFGGVCNFWGCSAQAVAHHWGKAYTSTTGRTCGGVCTTSGTTQKKEKKGYSKSTPTNSSDSLTSNSAGIAHKIKRQGRVPLVPPGKLGPCQTSPHGRPQCRVMLGVCSSAVILIFVDCSGTSLLALVLLRYSLCTT